MGKYRMAAGIRVLCVCSAAAALLCGCEQQAPEEDPLIVVEGSDDTLSNDYVIAGIGDVVLTGEMRCTYRQQKDQEISFALTGRLVDQGAGGGLDRLIIKGADGCRVQRGGNAVL